MKNFKPDDYLDIESKMCSYEANSRPLPSEPPEQATGWTRLSFPLRSIGQFGIKLALVLLFLPAILLKLIKTMTCICLLTIKECFRGKQEKAGPMTHYADTARKAGVLVLEKENLDPKGDMNTSKTLELDLKLVKLEMPTDPKSTMDDVDENGDTGNTYSIDLQTQVTIDDPGSPSAGILLSLESFVPETTPDFGLVASSLGNFVVTKTKDNKLMTDIDGGASGEPCDRKCKDFAILMDQPTTPDSKFEEDLRVVPAYDKFSILTTMMVPLNRFVNSVLFVLGIILTMGGNQQGDKPVICDAESKKSKWEGVTSYISYCWGAACVAVRAISGFGGVSFVNGMEVGDLDRMSSTAAPELDTKEADGHNSAWHY